jgi:molybdate transport system ATP-binding protein
LDVAIRLGAEVGILFGPSGAGKSSTLRLIAGLLRPDTGTISCDGDTLFDSARRVDVPLRSRRIGMIFQDDLLFPHRSVAGNIRYGLASWEAEKARARLAEVAELCGLSSLLGRYPPSLSGGERQRVGLARALAPRPRLLLCDEPVSALDFAARFALIERLRDVQRAEGIPVLFVTHNPAEAVAIGTRLFQMASGRVVEEAHPLDALARGVGAGSSLEGLQNVLAAVIEGHDRDGGETRLRLEGGPMLLVPWVDRPIGTRVAVAVRADDILLARGPVAGLSARNRLEGTVVRVVHHGREAEAVICSGSVTWIASVVASAVAALEIAPGLAIQMIIKARSCHLIDHAAGP